MKNIYALLCGALLMITAVHGQTVTTELQAEAIAERTGEQGWDDERHQQIWEWLLKHPLSLNTINEEELVETGLFTTLQVANFLQYRRLFGKLLSIYELQAVPGWDITLLQKLKPVLTVEETVRVWPSILSRLKNGTHQFLLRSARVLGQAGSAATRYAGSPHHILFRYRYKSAGGLEYGITGEKDAGEAFFGKAQPLGFDFCSAHLFVQRTGRLKALAVGDFTVQMGQGLIQWQGFALSKGADVLQIKRQSPVLRPYHGSGEFYFHRGIGITLGMGRWELTGFASVRRLDASRGKDSSGTPVNQVTALQNSGYHRTAGELADKSVQQQQVYGANLNTRTSRSRLGVNFLLYRFRYPFAVQPALYRRFAFSGSQLLNYSGYYSYTLHNFHFFGEVAADGNGHTAFVQGALYSAAPGIDMALLYRKISRTYHTLYSNAFTESDEIANESGLYTGITVRPGSAWRIEAYADMYRFPWLRYHADGPSEGTDYLVQAVWKPGKHLEAYSRFRSGIRSVNQAGTAATLPPPLEIPLRSWRLQVQYQLTAALQMRQRAEIVWYNRGNPGREEGFLWYTDLVFKPLLKPYSGNLRVMYFETDSYNTRLYAYENDVLYGGTVPFVQGKGWRFYINSHLNIRKNVSLWMRLSHTLPFRKSLISNVLNVSDISSQTEVKLQLLFTIQQF